MTNGVLRGALWLLRGFAMVTKGVQERCTMVSMGVKAGAIWFLSWCRYVRPGCFRAPDGRDTSANRIRLSVDLFITVRYCFLTITYNYIMTACYSNY